MTEKRKKRLRLLSEDSDISSSSLSSSSSSSSSSDEETDAKDLKPIKEYLNNKTDLASQLFKSVKKEKIHMMLPQILKKIDYKELQDLCANELIGMSKSRIMSILNGQEMLQSSDTDDSDNSGPSLEIISDTELISDDDFNVKVEGSKNSNDSKKKKKSQHIKTKVKKEKEKGKEKVNKDGKLSKKIKTEKVKTEKKDKEKAVEKPKEKEGESLLDLLELEMRARAIRALIQKEENSKTGKPGQVNSGASVSGTANDQTKARQASLKEQLEKIDVLMKHGDDEDVYVVINPAPTIDLLSSESEGENGSKKPRKKVSEPIVSKITVSTNSTSNERSIIIGENISESSNSAEKNIKISLNVEKTKETVDQEKSVKERELNNIKSSDKGTEKDKQAEKTNNSSTNLPISVVENVKEDLEEGEIIDNEEENKLEKKSKNTPEKTTPEASKTVGENVTESSPISKIKKIKKNPHIRLRNLKNDSIASGSEQQKSISNDKKIIEIPDSPEKSDNRESKEEVFDDKELDTALDKIEEIINLDNYPDDDEDIEIKQAIKPTKDNTEENEKESTAVAQSETWASRYYQKDEVQTVIKESKMQSEIRKRLRERQRLKKLEGSPTETASPEPTMTQPIGSVEEYLSLKGILTADNKNDDEENENSVALQDSSQNDVAESPEISEVPKQLEQKITIVRKPVLSIRKESNTISENIAVEKIEKILKCNDIVVEDSKPVVLYRIETQDITSETIAAEKNLEIKTSAAEEVESRVEVENEPEVVSELTTDNKQAIDGNDMKESNIHIQAEAIVEVKAQDERNNIIDSEITSIEKVEKELQCDDAFVEDMISKVEKEVDQNLECKVNVESFHEIECKNYSENKKEDGSNFNKNIQENLHTETDVPKKENESDIISSTSIKNKKGIIIKDVKALDNTRIIVMKKDEFMETKELDKIVVKSESESVDFHEIECKNYSENKKEDGSNFNKNTQENLHTETDVPKKENESDIISSTSIKNKKGIIIKDVTALDNTRIIVMKKDDFMETKELDKIVVKSESESVDEKTSMNETETSSVTKKNDSNTSVSDSNSENITVIAAIPAKITKTQKKVVAVRRSLRNRK